MPDSDAELTAEEKHYPPVPSLLDVDVYRSPSRHQQELDHVVLRGWFPVAPSNDVAAARHFLGWKQVEQSVLISRIDEGTISAWRNVCQQRGARLVDGSGNCSRGTSSPRGTASPTTLTAR